MTHKQSSVRAGRFIRQLAGYSGICRRPHCLPILLW